MPHQLNVGAWRALSPPSWLEPALSSDCIESLDEVGPAEGACPAWHLPNFVFNVIASPDEIEARNLDMGCSLPQIASSAMASSQ